MLCGAHEQLPLQYTHRPYLEHRPKDGSLQFRICRKPDSHQRAARSQIVDRLGIAFGVWRCYDGSVRAEPVARFLDISDEIRRSFEVDPFLRTELQTKLLFFCAGVCGGIVIPESDRAENLTCLSPQLAFPSPPHTAQLESCVSETWCARGKTITQVAKSSACSWNGDPVSDCSIGVFKCSIDGHALSWCR